MSDACYTARAATRDQVFAQLDKLSLPKSNNNQYNHAAAHKYTINVKRVLKSTFYPGAPGHGMSGLLTSSKDATNPSAVAAITSVDVATVDTVLAESIATAKAATTEDKIVQPVIITQADANEAADRLNQMRQAVIGAKEGATDAIVKKVGTAITDNVLRTSDGTDVKGVDDYELHQLINAIIQGATRPALADIRLQLAAIVNFPFDWRQTASTNLAVLRAKIDRLQAYGITVSDSQTVLVVMTNVEAAAREPYGNELRASLQTLRRAYAYNHAHDAVSLTAIMVELAAADAVRQLDDAPEPNNEGNANAVDGASSYVRRLFDDESSYADSGTAAAATYDSDSSNESAERRGRDRRARKKKGGGRIKSTKPPPRGRDSSRSGKSTDETADNNPCKHCKKHGRHKRHPHTEVARCFWNKKWGGWRPDYACRKMGMAFRPREEFSPEMGGYAKAYAVSDGETDSDDE